MREVNQTAADLCSRTRGQCGECFKMERTYLGIARRSQVFVLPSLRVNHISKSFSTPSKYWAPLNFSSVAIFPGCLTSPRIASAAPSTAALLISLIRRARRECHERRAMERHLDAHHTFGPGTTWWNRNKRIVNKNWQKYDKKQFFKYNVFPFKK